MFKSVFVAAALAIALPSVAAAATNTQLIRSVEHRLATIGLGQVDVSQLNRTQISALHLRLQGNYNSFGLERVRTQQDVKVILNWTGQERAHSINKSN